MDNLPELLAQPTPWGFTVGQTALVAIVAVILVSGWLAVRVALRITGLLFRLGCAALMIFVCGLVSFIMVYNYTTR
jgi:hypothetical protein